MIRPKEQKSGQTTASSKKNTEDKYGKKEQNYINNAITEGMENNNIIIKPFWKYVKSRKQDTIRVAPLKEKGKLVSQSKEKAQILIEQSSSVFTRGSVDNMPESHINQKSTISSIKNKIRMGGKTTKNHQSV